jgi:uncharacterized protein (TIRG00374 family)
MAAPADVTSPARPGALRWVSSVAWVAVTIAVLIAAPRLPWARAWDEIRRAQVSWLLAATALNFAILPLWAMEWRLLAPRGARSTFRAMFGVVAVTSSVLNTIPFFAGEAFGVGLLMARGGLPRGAALSVLAMDQLLVGVGKVAVVAIAALVAPLPDWLRAGVLTLVTGVCALGLAVLLLAHGWERARGWLSRASSAPAGLLARVVSWGRHFDAMREPGVAALLVTLALTKKLAELAAIVAVQGAFGLDLSLSTAILVLAALSVTTLLPVSPANLGVYEATVYSIYRFLGFDDATAFGIALLQHTVFLVAGLVPGYVLLTAQQFVSARQRG